MLIFSPPSLPFPSVAPAPPSSTAEISTQTAPQSRSVSQPCDLIKDNDKTTNFYTGLPSWDMFLKVFSLLAVCVPKKGHHSLLSLKDELLIVLMRLRLNSMLEDLGYRFHVSKSTISRIFQAWIDVMYARLKFLIVWPSRDVVRHNMPQVFKDLYPNCCCIIDVEFFKLGVERCSWSNFGREKSILVIGWGSIWVERQINIMS